MAYISSDVGKQLTVNLAYHFPVRGVLSVQFGFTTAPTSSDVTRYLQHRSQGTQQQTWNTLA